MALRFKNPPLLELIAELRWGSSGGGYFATTFAPFQLPGGGQHEEFFMRFGSKVAALGYDRIERVVPPGFPVAPFQAVYRFRKSPPEEGTSVYQVGPNVFNANNTPPYHSWDKFRPVIERGVDALLESRSEAEKAAEFTSASLRYVDAFGSQWTNGRSVAAFLREVLGFVIELPEALKREAAPGAEAKPLLQFALPLANGQQMALTLAEGLANNVQVFLMDTTVSASAPIAPNKAAVMAAFDAAHGVIHRSFVEITKRLHHVMVPIENGEEQ